MQRAAFAAVLVLLFTTLRPGSKAVDAGIRPPNVNDDSAGRAPDLGAYESGQPVPHYGPR